MKTVTNLLSAKVSGLFGKFWFRGWITRYGLMIDCRVQIWNLLPPPLKRHQTRGSNRTLLSYRYADLLSEGNTGSSIDCRVASTGKREEAEDNPISCSEIALLAFKVTSRPYALIQRLLEKSDLYSFFFWIMHNFCARKLPERWHLCKAILGLVPGFLSTWRV